MYQISELNTNLSTLELERISLNPEQENVSYVQPAKPKGGHVYVSDFRGDPNKISDAKADQIRWRQDSRKAFQTSSENVTLYKIYLYVVIKKDGKLQKSALFKKYISYLSSEPLVQIVEYIGD